MSKIPSFTCCLCGAKCTGYGNNPAPVKSTGRACSECDATHVIPARLVAMGYSPETARKIGAVIASSTF